MSVPAAYICLVLTWSTTPLAVQWSADGVGFSFAVFSRMLVSVLLAISLAQVSLPSIAPRHPTSAYWFGAVLGVVGFLVSLVGHELGHSYIAQRNGVRVAEITLWLFGGVAKLEGDADEPGAEFRIAAAGPAMSMVIAVLATPTR